MNIFDLAKVSTLADLESVAKGDKPGHPFYGNQHVSGDSGGGSVQHADGSGHDPAKATYQVAAARADALSQMAARAVQKANEDRSSKTSRVAARLASKQAANAHRTALKHASGSNVDHHIAQIKEHTANASHVSLKT